MSWIYRQSSGELSHDGKIMDKHAYSGHGAGKNNPAMQTVRAVGPIPRGTYRIGKPRSSNHLGPYVMALTPMAGTNMFGRSAFFIHGDSIRHPGHASDGCVIAGNHVRHLIWSSGDHVLKVTK